MIALTKAFRGTVSLAISLAIWHMATVGEQSIIVLKLEEFVSHYKEPVLYPFVENIKQVSKQQMLIIAELIGIVSLLRFCEAFGLWSEKRWAEILVLLTSLIYLPFGLYALMNQFTYLMVMILSINLLVSGYLLRTLLKARLLAPVECKR